MKLTHKIQAAGIAIASNAFLSAASYAAATTAPTTACSVDNNSSGAEFWTVVTNFIGSPVFYLVMFLLALGGLYTAIVKQDTAGWWAVGFAAVGAASPQIFGKIAEFFCGVMNPIVS